MSLWEEENIAHIGFRGICPVGLHTDGSVICGEPRNRGKCEWHCVPNKWGICSDWRNITVIACDLYRIYGLKAGGTVVFCGRSPEFEWLEIGDKIEKWRDVVSIAAHNKDG